MHYSKLSILMLAGLTTAGVIRERDTQPNGGAAIQNVNDVIESKIIVAEREPQATVGVSPGDPATQPVNPAPVPTQAGKRDGDIAERDPQATQGGAATRGGSGAAPAPTRAASRRATEATGVIDESEENPTVRVIERDPQATRGAGTRAGNGGAPAPTRAASRRADKATGVIVEEGTQATQAKLKENTTLGVVERDPQATQGRAATRAGSGAAPAPTRAARRHDTEATGQVIERDPQATQGGGATRGGNGAAPAPTQAASRRTAEASGQVIERNPQATQGNPAATRGGSGGAPAPTQAASRRAEEASGVIVEREPEASGAFDPEQPAPSPLKREDSDSTAQVVEREPQVTGGVSPGGPVTQPVNPVPAPTQANKREVESTLRIVQRTTPQETAIAVEDITSP